MEIMVAHNLFGGIYRGKKVLLTGHSGFKGSWLQLWLEKLGASVTGLSLGPVSNPSHSALLGPDKTSLTVDIRDAAKVSKVVSDARPDIVFHLAAQPLVRRSYADPRETFETNIMGTVNLLDAIKRSPSVKAFVNVTTDKVYRNREEGIAYKETDMLGSNDPYSTSKACVELVHETYARSFLKEAGIRSATARAGNVIGGGDWAQDRLIPDLVRAASTQQSTDIRNPDSVRPWQHVLDPLSGYLLLGMQLLMGNSNAETAWNFGPEWKDCLSVSEVLNLFMRHWAGIRWNDISGEKKVHEAGILRLDCSNANEQLKWAPVWDVQRAIEKTASWYKAFYADGTLLSTNDLDTFIADAALRRLAWAI